MPFVFRLRLSAVLLLLSLWLPAQLHCRLEAAGLIPAEACCATDTGLPATETCGDDLCGTVEGEFQIPAKLDFPAPVLVPCAGLFSICAPVQAMPAKDSPDPGVSEFSAAPHEVSRGWVFVERAAPAPRAP